PAPPEEPSCRGQPVRGVGQLPFSRRRGRLRHETVKAWLERTGREVSVAGVVRRRATDPFRHLIRERVEVAEGRVRGKRVLRVLQAAGYRDAAAGAPRGEGELAATPAPHLPTLAVGAGRLPHRGLGRGRQRSDCGRSAQALLLLCRARLESLALRSLL